MLKIDETNNLYITAYKTAHILCKFREPTSGETQRTEKCNKKKMHFLLLFFKTRHLYTLRSQFSLMICSCICHNFTYMHNTYYYTYTLHNAYGLNSYIYEVGVAPSSLNSVLCIYKTYPKYIEKERKTECVICTFIYIL